MNSRCEKAIGDYLSLTQYKYGEFDLLGSIFLKTYSPLFDSPHVPSLDHLAPSLDFRYAVKALDANPTFLAYSFCGIQNPFFPSTGQFCGSSATSFGVGT